MTSGMSCAVHVLIARRRHLQRRRQVGPELEAVHAALRVALRHLLMQDAAAGRHPLHVAGAERAAVAEAVAVVDRAGEHVGDGLDAAMRMPREAGEVVVRVVVAEIVEQQERIELAGVAEPKRAAQLHARAFHGRLGLDDALHGSDGHDACPFFLLLRSLRSGQVAARARGTGRRSLAGNFRVLSSVMVPAASISPSLKVKIGLTARDQHALREQDGSDAAARPRCHAPERRSGDRSDLAGQEFCPTGARPSRWRSSAPPGSSGCARGSRTGRRPPPRSRP